MTDPMLRFERLERETAKLDLRLIEIGRKSSELKRIQFNRSLFIAASFAAVPIAVLLAMTVGQ